MSENEVIDSGKALHWLDGDVKMLEKIGAIFMKNIPAQVDMLGSFIKSGDGGSIERAAHTIMGSSAMMGAGKMSEEAGKIERYAMAGDLDSVEKHFSIFQREYEKVMQKLAPDRRSE